MPQATDKKPASIFNRLPGSTCLSIFDKKDDGKVTPDGKLLYKGGRFDTRNWVDKLRNNGHVDFEFEVSPPRPFKRYGDDEDIYDLKDVYAPADKTMDTPSIDFSRLSNRVAKDPSSSENMIALVDDGGVRKRVLKPGKEDSDGTDVIDGCRVWIHYDTFINKGGKLTLLDSTGGHGLATTLEVGKDGILGLYYALTSMKKGEISELLVESEYGYGNIGIPYFIEGGQSLRMVVQLVDISHTNKKPISFLSEVERLSLNLTLEETFDEVEKLIQAGNEKFKKKSYRQACDRYNWALELFQDFRTKEYEYTPEEEMIDKKCYQLYANLAICYNHLDEYDETEKVCEAALSLIHSDTDLKPKVLFRYATALYKSGKYEDATKQCRRGLTSTWGKSDFQNLMKKVEIAAAQSEQSANKEEEDGCDKDDTSDHACDGMYEKDYGFFDEGLYEREI